MAKTSTLVDTFDSGIGAAWVTSGTVSAVSGGVQISHGTTAYSLSYLESATTYDLTESSFYFKIADFGTGTATVTDIKLFIGPDIDGGNAELIQVSGNYLAAGGFTAWTWSPASGGVTLNTTNHAWWRMRHASAVVYWDSSPDGVTWTNQGSRAALAWSYTAVKVRIQCGLNTTSGAADAIRVDNVNTTPTTAPPGDEPAFETGVVAGYDTTTLPVPSGVQADDIIVCGIFQSISLTVAVSSAPSGFTPCPDSPAQIDDAIDGKLFLYWKRATGTDTGTYDFTLNESPVASSGFAARYSGAVTSGDPWDDTAAASNFDSDATAAASVTTTDVNRLLVWVNASNTGYQITTPATGFTMNLNGVNDDSNYGFGVGSKAQAAAGSSGSVSGTWDASHNGVGIAWLGALKPAVTAAPTVGAGFFQLF